MTSSRVAWFQCANGIAGDMILGSLLDAGASLDAIRKSLEGLHLPGWSIETEQVTRGGISATRLIVTVDDDDTARPYGIIRDLLERADIDERVRSRSQRAFEHLARVEAAIHRTTLEDVHFHEVGGHDALIDVVGSMAALEDLGIDDVFVSPIGLGHGTITSAHGSLPSPAPATLALLEGFVVTGVDLPVELATPTGAAIVKALCESSTPLPPMTISSQGFGAGTREIEGVANVVGVLVGEATLTHDDAVVLLETTLDDVSGEVLGATISHLLEEGALDAWATPVKMKKNRPGHVLSVLGDPKDLETLKSLVATLTGTLGIRASLVSRTIHQRSFVDVGVLGHTIAIKVSDVNAKPEFDDVARVANATGRSLIEIDSLANHAYQQRRDAT